MKPNACRHVIRCWMNYNMLCWGCLDARGMNTTRWWLSSNDTKYCALPPTTTTTSSAPIDTTSLPIERQRERKVHHMWITKQPKYIRWMDVVRRQQPSLTFNVAQITVYVFIIRCPNSTKQSTRWIWMDMFRHQHILPSIVTSSRRVLGIANLCSMLRFCCWMHNILCARTYCVSTRSARRRRQRCRRRWRRRCDNVCERNFATFAGDEFFFLLRCVFGWLDGAARRWMLCSQSAQCNRNSTHWNAHIQRETLGTQTQTHTLTHTRKH